MSSAKYTYSIKSDSGYTSKAQGSLSVEQHVAVEAILNKAVNPKAASAADQLLASVKDLSDCLSKCLTGGEVTAKHAGRALVVASELIESLE